MMKYFYSISVSWGQEPNIQTKYERIISKEILCDAFIKTDAGAIGLNGDKIAEKVFPLLKGHKIFISHSHQDEALAIKVAKIIKKTYGVDSFIDSQLWGNVYDLANEIIIMHHEKGSSIYQYNICESVFAHIFNMLNIALSEAMRQADVFVFLNTLTSTERIDDELWIASPWLYYELSFTSILASFQNSFVKSSKQELLLENFSIFRKMPIDHLTKISWGNFKNELGQIFKTV